MKVVKPNNTIENIQYLMEGNIFLTGPPGTGKSYTIKKYIEKCEHLKIAITASTGIAAKIIGGVTINSWAGIGLADTSKEKILEKIKNNPRKKKSWMKTDVLVIDEISMLSWETWEILNYIGMELRKSSRPFGGIKIIATGDFYQLPPVKGTMLIERDFLSYFDYTIILTKSYRSQDPTLNTILQSVRTGCELSDNQHLLLKSRVDKENITYPLLVSLRDTAYTMNNDKLSKNNNGNVWSNMSETYCIDMKTNAKIHSNEILESIATNECNLESKIVLKIGAPVIYLVNDMMNGLVNGSVGTIVKFNGNNPVAQFSEGKLVEIEKHNYRKEFPDANTTVIIEQYPLLLAYALTIHRAQGQTLSQGTLLLDNTIFECGQAYVALSRFQTLDSITLLRYKKSVFKINSIVKDFYDKLDLNNCL